MNRFFVDCSIEKLHNGNKYSTDNPLFDNAQDSAQDLSHHLEDDTNNICSETEQIKIISITSNEDVLHIKKSLRLKNGDQLEIVDADKQLYICEIVSIDNTVKCSVLRRIEQSSESPIEIVLYQGLPKGEKFDFIIQKSIELGVDKIVPVMFDRCVVKWKADKSSDKKHLRWNKIAYEAVKQCKRQVIPEVEKPIKLDELISRISNESQSNLSLLFYEEEDTLMLKQVLEDFVNNLTNTKVSAIVGPEGGLEEYEVEKLKSAGVNCVSLGKRILRTETAGMAVVAVIQYALGDLG